MGGPVDMVIGSGTKCFNANFTFPDLTLPGLPKMLLGTFLTSMGGINLVLDFLPVPDPLKLPKLKPPTLQFFLDIFAAAVGLPSIPGWDVSGFFALLKATVNMIFGLFSELILGIFSLSPKLPTLDLALSLFKKFGVQFGIPVDMKFECVPKAVIGLLTSLLPL